MYNHVRRQNEILINWNIVPMNIPVKNLNACRVMYANSNKPKTQLQSTLRVDYYGFIIIRSMPIFVVFVGTVEPRIWIFNEIQISIKLYSNFGGTTKSFIHENSGFLQSTEISTNKKKWVHRILKKVKNINNTDMTNKIWKLISLIKFHLMCCFDKKSNTIIYESKIFSLLKHIYNLYKHFRHWTSS